MERVFILQHERPENDEYWEDVKLIGAFSSEAAARAAIEQLRVQPGFQDWPDGFSIDEFKIDSCSWEEGFIHGGPDKEGPKGKR